MSRQRTTIRDSAVEGAAVLAVTAASTCPLTAHQPESVFMEAEKDGALPEGPGVPVLDLGCGPAVLHWNVNWVSCAEES